MAEVLGGKVSGKSSGMQKTSLAVYPPLTQCKGHQETVRASRNTALLDVNEVGAKILNIFLNIVENEDVLGQRGKDGILSLS